jgi:hypothetical protein
LTSPSGALASLGCVNPASAMAMWVSTTCLCSCVGCCGVREWACTVHLWVIMCVQTGGRAATARPTDVSALHAHNIKAGGSGCGTSALGDDADGGVVRVYRIIDVTKVLCCGCRRSRHASMLILGLPCAPVVVIPVSSCTALAPSLCVPYATNTVSCAHGAFPRAGGGAS